MEGIRQLTGNNKFVSYSYLEEKAKSSLAKKLPKKYDVVTHPKQEVEINQAVSDGIVQKIINCDNLIFWTTEKSQESNRVRFERTYALQLGKKVFASDHRKDFLFHIDFEFSPIDVNVIVSEESFSRVQSIFEWLEQERFIKLKAVPLAKRLKEVPDKVVQLISDEKPILWFLDRDTWAYALSITRELPTELIAEHYNRINKTQYSELSFDGFPRWLQQNTIFIKIDDFTFSCLNEEDEIRYYIVSEEPGQNTFYNGHGIDLGKEGEINMNKVDDMLTKLIMKSQTHQSLISVEDDEDGY